MQIALKIKPELEKEVEKGFSGVFVFFFLSTCFMVIIFLILKYPLYISNWTEEINTQNCEWTINFWGR